MFRLLNKAIIGIRHAIVCPCKLGAIDGRIGNFTQTTLHPWSWHELNPETAKRNDWNGTNETNKTNLNKRNHRNDKNETNPTTILKRPKRPQRNDRNYQNNIQLILFRKRSHFQKAFPVFWTNRVESIKIYRWKKLPCPKNAAHSLYSRTKSMKPASLFASPFSGS